MRCTECAESYETIDEIPDLRHPKSRDSSVVSDLAFAGELSRRAQDTSDEDLVRAFFAVRDGSDGWTASDTDLRSRHSLAAPGSLMPEVVGWLTPVTDQTVFLDLGCGLGGLLSSARSAGKNGIGIDNRMSVLVIARRLLCRQGATPSLACANAEALPLADDSVGGVVMYDVVEHVERLESALAEVNRVTWTGGALACSTPNRFSLAPEPHVHLWGVGWLPRKYQSAYVRLRSGRDYGGTRLLSPRELGQMLGRSTRFSVDLRVPPIPAGEIERSRGVRRVLARVFNSMSRLGAIRPLLLRIGPFFQLIAIKRAPVTQAAPT